MKIEIFDPKVVRNVNFWRIAPGVYSLDIDLKKQVEIFSDLFNRNFYSNPNCPKYAFELIPETAKERKLLKSLCIVSIETKEKSKICILVMNIYWKQIPLHSKGNKIA